MKKFLFVCGCARSGTSILASLLMSHPAIVIGLERYINLLSKKPSSFVPELFTKNRFFDLQEGDTFYKTLDQFKLHYAGADDKYDNSIYLGDKIPRLFNHLPHIRKTFPGAKVIFITRNLFDVATSFKRRAIDEKDTHWSKDRTVIDAISDWNAAHRNALENFYNIDTFVIQFETWLESDDLTPLFNFLELPVTEEVTKRYSEIRANFNRLLTKNSHNYSSILSPSEKLMVMKDGDFPSYKKLMLNAITAKRAIYPIEFSKNTVANKNQPAISSPTTPPPYKYAQEDWEIVDYFYTSLPPTKRVFRGPLPDKKVLTDGNFISYLGAAQTFGRLVDKPFPTLVAERLGTPALNLASGGGKPQFYLQNPALLDYVNRSQCAVIQVMSARGLENSEFLPIKIDNVFLKRKSAISEPALFADRAYQALLASESPERVLEIVQETQARWVTEMLELLDRITVPTILLWFSRRSPEWSPLCTSWDTLMGDFPHFINKDILDNIRKKTSIYLECITKPSAPRLFSSRFTGHNVDVKQNVIQYYPDQEEHRMVAESLSYALKIILNAKNKENTENKP